MSRITITFAQDGHESVSYEIPAAVAAVMQAHVDSLRQQIPQTAPDGSVSWIETNPYDGSKAVWFKSECIRLILKPLVEKYARLIPQVSEIDEQIRQLEAAKRVAIETSILKPLGEQG
jgi:hypothetical protein